VVDKAGHHVHRDQPDSMARSLIAFWARAEAGAPACPAWVGASAGAGRL